MTFTIRKSAGLPDLPGIEGLVSAVVRECYGHLLPDYRFDAAEHWADAWIAELGGAAIGVLLTGGNWIEDLWIARPQRRRGIGARLLQMGEGEVAARGHERALLRVVAENRTARNFYLRHGWQELRAYPHEIHGFGMVEMAKDLPAPSAGPN